MSKRAMKKVLSIAGSDCSGGAGIQGDMKTIMVHKMYAMSAITALTAQNTTGVYGIKEVDGSFLELQLDCIFTDIYPDAVKIGMVPSVEGMNAIVKKLKKYKAINIVLDPVMVSTSGHGLMNEDAMENLKTNLIPMSDIITPNLSEAERLCGFKISGKEHMIKAAEVISDMTKGWVLVKGGHLVDCADDLLYRQGKSVWFLSAKWDNPNTHGSGCTLSSAIACNLADGMDMEQSVKAAKTYITGAIRDEMRLGKGKGPLNHLWRG